jgi:ubiquinone/menaquinone biosynthesis C-methylase UbiE
LKAYYHARAREYDDWWLGRNLYADKERPGWEDARTELEGWIADLPPARTLDVACGTGYATRWLPGEITGLDQSANMLAIAQERLPQATFVQGDALALPFDDDSFDRVVTMSFYGHLEGDDRTRFLAEARRVARELVVVDAALRDDTEPEEQQERILNDGSAWTVYKRYFTADGLADELGGGETVYDGRWFVVVRSPR